MEFKLFRAWFSWGPYLYDRHSYKNTIPKESRRIQDQHLANAKAQAEFMLKQAKDKADRMIQDAEKHSAQIRVSLIRDLEKAISNL